jgi:glucose/arabinose dehydrogenase
MNRQSLLSGVPAHRWLVGLCGLLAVVLAAGCKAQAKPGMPPLRLPPGFQAQIYAEVPGARSLALGEDGTVYVGGRESGKVYALRDDGHSGHADRVYVLASGLNQPNGVAVHDGALYVAEIGRILRYPDIAKHLDAPPAPQVVRADLPTETHHGWRYIGFGPDGKLYVAIGAPCNVCVPEQFSRGDARLEYGSITRMNPDGSGWELVARGVRNSVGFDWQPGTGAFWFSSNGRDMLGDDLPADTLNRLPGPLLNSGAHFGFPYCHQGDLPDPEYGAGHSCADYTPPALKLEAHVATLGLRFYTGTQFPPQYRGQIFLAEHGSWNRSSKIGYRVVSVRVEGDKALSATPFVEGWLQPGEKTLGRPVDVLVMPDGALLVSDDFAGRVYRISYTAGPGVGSGAGKP